MKKAKEKWMVLLMALLMIASTGLLSASAFSSMNYAKENVTGTCGENLTWTLDAETGELTISGTGRMDDYDYGTIPWINYRDSIESVTVSNGVTRIGNWAFHLIEGITSFIIPDSVTSVGSWAFSSCSNLTDVVIPNSITNIGWGAFDQCTSLTSVTIPSGLIVIEKNAFADCTSLASFTVDENNTVFSSDANGVLYNKDKTTLIQYPCGNVRNTFTIPDTVTTIGYLAFSGSTNLTSISIPNSVKVIGTSGFSKCTGLKSITIPDSVTSIGDWAFYKCTNLSSVTIPNSVTSIDSLAFYECTGLTFVHIPASVTSIGIEAFSTNDKAGNTFPLSLYICSSTANCYAKTYADANGIEFRICTEHDPVIAIRNYASTKTIDYRTTITFSADVTNQVDGASIHWFINGQDKGASDTHTEKEAKANFTVQAKYIKDGKVLVGSEIETVKVNVGFFARLKAFFRALFGRLPNIVQEYLVVEKIDCFLP